jgi:hypothetical protein
MKLEMGEGLTHIVRGGTKRPIATPQEVLALTQGGRRQTRPPPQPPGGGRIDLTCQHIGGRPAGMAGMGGNPTAAVPSRRLLSCTCRPLRQGQVLEPPCG